jgi:Bacterial SH3 domain
MPACPFKHQTFSFEGTPVNQARCLLRKVLPLGNVDNTPANLPTILENMVGQPCDITRAQLAAYLVSNGIQVAAIGGELDQPVSRTDSTAAPATSARYFVIHDTSTLHRAGHFTAATATFPESINTEQWSGNNLSNANGMTTHVMIARTGLSATSNNYRTALRATKRERTEYAGNPNAVRGLFLHHELVQPRLQNMSGIDQFAPDPGFTLAQYERLAVCYYAIAVRSGSFLIPAFHCVLDLGIPDGHDDPQRFDLDAWGIALEAVGAAITRVVEGGILRGRGRAGGEAPAALEHGIINSPDGEANVRSGPSQAHEIIALLHNGEGVDIYARSGQWRRIAPGQEQWVHGSLISITRGDAGDAISRITRIAAASNIASFDWPQRGVAPIGYIKGMAVTFARAVCKLRAGDPVAVEMAKAATGSAADDCLVHYRQKFTALGMDNSVAGVDTLRHLFVLMLGLGMRESSGAHCCGRDKSANNVSGEKAEAGLFQTSWNARSEHNLMVPLFEHYRANPDTGFLDIFAEDVRCNAADLANHGQGTGRVYQELAKKCPAFHTEFTALAMRNTSQHWGPIINRAALLKDTANQMFRKVQQFVESNDVCPI